MRESKFRGKRLDNGEWVYGYYYTQIITHAGNRKSRDHFIRTEQNIRYEVDPDTVGQYTGIHDNSEDETEVFEGDVVEFFYGSKQYIGEVKFEAGTFILGCNRLPDSYITLLDIIEIDRDYFWIDGIVKGNKYDNPELLKEGD